MSNFKRIGNWYSVVVNDVEYNVVIQREKNSILCEPSSIIVFDEDFKEINTPSVIDDMITLFERVDWKYDMLDDDE
jgi:hypothetical protein